MIFSLRFYGLACFWRMFTGGCRHFTIKARGYLLPPGNQLLGFLVGYATFKRSMITGK
jgi:hypothetical protein